MPNRSYQEKILLGFEISPIIYRSQNKMKHKPPSHMERSHHPEQIFSTFSDSAHW